MVSTRGVHISISCTVELVSVYLLFWCYASSVNTCLEVEQYSVVIWSSLLQETFLRRYMFQRIHIQEEESFVRISSLYADRWTLCFSTIIVEGASLRSNIITYCMWLSCVYLIYNNILLEISGSHSNIISDSYIFHYGNELVSRTGKRKFVTSLQRITIKSTPLPGVSKSCILYQQHYCTVLKQCVSAKLQHGTR